MSVVIPALRKRRMQASTETSKRKSGALGAIQMLAQFMLGQRSLFIKATLMLILEAYTAVQLPLLTAFVVNYLTKRLEQIRGIPVIPPASPLAMLGIPKLIHPDVDTILVVTLGFIVLTMINSLADSIAEIYLARGGRKLGYNLRVGLYSHLQKLSLAFHDQRRTGDILTRVTSDVAALEDFVISSLSDFVGSMLLIVFILYVMVTKAWQVAVLAAVIIPIMALISNYFTQRIKAASKKLRASEGELASAAHEMLASIRVIQTYGLGSYEQGMFSEQSQKAMNAALEAAGLQARFSWIVSVLGAISTAAVIWMGVWLIFRDPITADIGLLTAFIVYIKDMFKPTKRIIQEWNTLAKLYASLERIGDLFDRKPAVQDAVGAISAPPLKGFIEFRNVSFAYQPAPGNDGNGDAPRLALKNLNFEIAPGQVLAIVGHTGAGKSTIVQLLPRLYDPLEGQILIDGHDLREFTLESLRGQMSMVLQETILFTGSVVENIAYGRTDATWADIIEAAKQANAHEFIERMPEKYYTLLGERGANLSGGQRQRIAIARAFIRNTPVLILDEPSTGLDAESTDLVLRALRMLMKGKTTVIISHDLNLIRNADKIVVIKQGEIEQMGTHESLLESGGLYANLYMKQFGVVEVPPPPSRPVEADVTVRITRKKPHLGEAGVDTWIASPLGTYLDLPRSLSMLSKLPALATAFDDQAMQDILQQGLFGKEESPFEIVSCVPGKAIYLPENVCSMQYDIRVREKASGQAFSAVVNARLFPNLEDCEDYRSQFLAPLAAQMRGRPEIEPYTTPVAVIEDLKMALSVFPIDGILPTLIGATDRQRMIRIFNETLPDVLSGNFIVEDLKLELAHYGRYRRCVIRYTVEGRLTENNYPYRQVVYGKVDADSYGGLTIPVIAALLERTRNDPNGFHFAIPHSIGFLPDLRLLLMEALPGNLRMKDLLLDRLCKKQIAPDGNLALEEAIKTCALIVSALHCSGIKLGRRRSFEDETGYLKNELQAMKQVFPKLGSEIEAWLDEVITFTNETTSMPLCFSHGDFTYSQLVFQDSESGLVDFDSICQAEPALDLGQFLGYQRMVICKEQNPDDPLDADEVERLSELFLSTYIAASGDRLGDLENLRARVMAYETISLIRLAVHSWEKLKGIRLKHTIKIIKERMSCLAKVR